MAVVAGWVRKHLTTRHTVVAEGAQAGRLAVVAAAAVVVAAVEQRPSLVAVAVRNLVAATAAVDTNRQSLLGLRRHC